MANAVVVSIQVLVEELGVREVGLVMLAWAPSIQPPVMRVATYPDANAIILGSDKHCSPSSTHTLILSLFLTSTGWMAAANVAISPYGEVLVIERTVKRRRIGNPKT